MLKTHIKSPTPRIRLSFKHVISPPKKKTITYVRVQVVDLKDEEENTHSNQVGCEGDEDPQEKAT
jgi:hypothetical protein